MTEPRWDDDAFVAIGHDVEVTPLLVDERQVGVMERHWCPVTDRYQRTYLPFADTGDWDPPSASRWKVEKMEPLTMSPSVLCGGGCGKHGLIREGQWIDA